MDDVTRSLATIARAKNPGTSRQAARRAAIIHRRKFMDGKVSVEQSWREMAVPAGTLCAGCKSLGVVLGARVYMSTTDVAQRDPEGLGAIVTNPALADRLAEITLQTTKGPYLLISRTFACRRCASALERVVARKTPSYCIVEWDRCPAEDKGTAQVGYTGPTL